MKNWLQENISFVGVMRKVHNILNNPQLYVSRASDSSWSNWKHVPLCYAFYAMWMELLWSIWLCRLSFSGNQSGWNKISRLLGAQQMMLASIVSYPISADVWNSRHPPWEPATWMWISWPLQQPMSPHPFQYGSSYKTVNFLKQMGLLGREKFLWETGHHNHCPHSQNIPPMHKTLHQVIMLSWNLSTSITISLSLTKASDNWALVSCKPVWHQVHSFRTSVVW